MCLSPRIEVPTDTLGQEIADFSDAGSDHSNDVCDYISFDNLEMVKSNDKDLIVLQLHIQVCLVNWVPYQN